MLEQAPAVAMNDPFHLFLNFLFFPKFFQADMIAFAWGVGDPLALALAKRILLLLPVAAVIASLWSSIAGLLTLPFRQRRQDFATSLLASWWDLLKGVMLFWAGLGKLFIVIPAAVFALVKGVLVFLWLLLQDMVLTPYRLVKNMARSVSQPGLPWIAFVITLAWCLLEAVIFTYVMSPLVMDTLSNLTGENLAEAVVRIPLFLFMFFLILGSYAVLSTWSEALRTKDVAAIIRISVIELVAISVEVVFLYREFVDSLVPWFAQYSGSGFEMGMGTILAISFMMWAGIRGMTWYLFASYGTPTILAILKGKGLEQGGDAGGQGPEAGYSSAMSFYRMMLKDMDEVKRHGEAFAEAVVLPPLQVVAASLNFLALLVTARHILEVPLGSLQKVLEQRPRLAETVAAAKKKNGKGRGTGPDTGAQEDGGVS